MKGSTKQSKPLAAARCLQLLIGAADSVALEERPRSQHESLWMAAESALEAGDSTRSLALLSQAEQLEAFDWHPVHAVRRLNVLGAAHMAAARPQEAMRSLQLGLTLSTTHGLARYALILRCDLAKLRLALGHLAAAASEFAEVARASQARAADRVNLSDALAGLAECQLQLGHRAQALQCLREAAALWARNGSLRAKARVVASLLQRLGLHSAAAQWIGASDVEQAQAHLGPEDTATLEQLRHLHSDEAVRAWLPQGSRLSLGALLAPLEDTVAAEPLALAGASQAAPSGRTGVWVFLPTAPAAD